MFVSWKTTILTFLYALFFAISANAVPTSLSFQTKIFKPDGQALEAASVNFRFTTVDSTGTCILYVEDFNNKNMQSSMGIAVFTLGAGSKVYPATAYTFTDVFSNTQPLFTCQNSSTFSPTATDSRKIIAQFHDGSAAGWQTLPPVDVNSVPYANFSGDAEKLSGFTAANFVRISTIPVCGAGNVLTYNGTNFSCVSSGGAVGDATAAAKGVVQIGTGLAVATGLISVQYGITGTTAAVGNDARITGAAQKASNLSDLVDAAAARTNLGLGTTSSPTFTGLTITGGVPSIGKVLTSDATGVASWQVPAGTGTVTSASVVTANGFSGTVANPSTTPSITLSTSVTGILKGNGSAISAAVAGDFPILNQNTTGTAANVTGLVAVANGGTGATSAANNMVFAGPSSGGPLAPSFRLLAASDIPNLSATYLPLAGGTMTGALVNTTSSASAAVAVTQAGAGPAATFMGGNVGIGTTAPQNMLEVAGGLTVADGSKVNATMRFSSANTGIGTLAGIADRLYMITSGSLGATIGNGNMLIGADYGALGATYLTSTNTAGSPAFGFYGEGLGMFRPSSNTLAFSAGNVETMRISSTGNVGIGTAAPAARLQVGVAPTATANFPVFALGTAPFDGLTAGFFTGNANGTFVGVNAAAGYTGDLVNLQIAGVSRFKVDASGNITNTGTTTTSGNTSATGNYSTTGNISTTGTGAITSAGVLTANSGAASTSPLTGSLIVTGGAGVSGTLNVGSNIVASGNISTVASAAATAVANQNSPNMYLTANYWNGAVSAVDQWSIQNILGAGTNPTSTLQFGHTGSTGAAQYAFMNGNVGIGTAAPTEKLHVVGNINLPTSSATVGQIKVNGSLFMHSTAVDNVFLGRNAGNITLTGVENAAVGTRALEWLTNGDSNAAFGAYAMGSNTTGSYNAALGTLAMAGNVTGSSNTAVGDRSLQLNTGHENTGVGAATLGASTANANTAVGYAALNANTTGTNNVAIGWYAGRAFGSTVNTTGSNNIFIGADSGVNGGVQLDNVVVIGKDARASASNSVILGNNANVGIGTTAPAAKLAVVGNSILGGNTAATGATASDTTISGDTYFGTSGSWKVTAAGVSSFGYLAVNSPGGVGSQIDTMTASPTTIGIRAKASALQTADMLQIQDSGAAIIAGISATGGGFFADKVGIGTAVPVDTFSIGTAPVASATRAVANFSNTALVGGSGNGTYIGANPAAFLGNFIDLQVGGASRFKVDNTGKVYGDGSGLTGVSGSASLNALTAATAANTPIDNLNFAQTWNWSTATTQTPLSISADSITTGSLLNLTSSSASVNSTNGLLYVANTSAGTAGTVARIQSNSAVDSGLTVLASGNVGVGTTAPYVKFQVQDGPAVIKGSGATLVVKKGFGSPNNLSSESVASFDNESPGTGTAINMFVFPQTSASLYFGDSTQPQGGYLRYHSDSVIPANQYMSFATNGAEKMRIDSIGNVGIGTTTPGLSLDIGTKTDAVRLPNGTTAQRPGTAVNGDIRYNSTLSKLETYEAGTWINVVGSAVPGWSLTGNAGTTAGANFIGTTDSADLIFQQNGIRSGLLNSVLANTSWGVYALYSTTTGHSNTAVGASSLQSNTTGFQNTGIGRFALATSTGYNNTAVGSDAGKFAGSSIRLTAIGAGAMGNGSNSGADDSTAVGFNALYNNSGVQNSAFGSYAGRNITSGVANAYFGSIAGYFNVTGNSNSAFGNAALSNNYSGEANTAIGSNALSNSGSGSNNVAVGFLALNAATGSNNIALGSNAGNAITTGSNNVVIGSNSGSTFATTSNNISINDGAGNERIRVLASGNVGIGITAPAEKLEVAGNLNVGSQTTRTTDLTNRGQLAQASTYIGTTNVSTTVSWNNGNIQEINSFVCDGTKTITMTNVKDGAAYTLLLTGDAAHTGTCIFSAAGKVFKTSGPTVAPTTSKDVLFTFVVINNFIIYNMVDNLQ